MDIVSFLIESHTITYEMNWLGIETVTVNGTRVSKKLSLPFRKHRFSLKVYGKTEEFYIRSKQTFSSGHIEVLLYHNEVCIDKKLLKFDFTASFNRSTTEHSNNSSFVYACIFLMLVIVFDWPKFFLFVALLYFFSTLVDKPKTENRQ